MSNDICHDFARAIADTRYDNLSPAEREDRRDDRAGCMGTPRRLVIEVKAV
jgi:hypothetical protein